MAKYIKPIMRNLGESLVSAEGYCLSGNSADMPGGYPSCESGSIASSGYCHSGTSAGQADCSNGQSAPGGPCSYGTSASNDCAAGGTPNTN